MHPFYELAAKGEQAVFWNSDWWLLEHGQFQKIPDTRVFNLGVIGLGSKLARHNRMNRRASFEVAGELRR